MKVSARQPLTWLLIVMLFTETAVATLRIGMDLSYPPFETISPDGHPTGISVDIAYALGRALKQKIIIENIPFIGLVPSLKSGYIDLIISSMTPTKQREQSIDFSLPYLSTGLNLLINSQSPLESIDDANDPHFTIAVKTGTSGEAYAKTHLPLATVRVLDKAAMCVLEVVEGKAAAFIYDEYSIALQHRQHPNTTKVPPIPFQKENLAIGIRKGNQNLLNQVNDFLKYSPEYEAIRQQATKALQQ